MADIRQDLARPHKFAHERVGFMTARAAAGRDHIVILAEEYFPVSDDDYLPDRFVGARINQEAIRKALELALLRKASVFHVHMHLLPAKRLWFSYTDLEDQDRLIPDFRSIRPEMPHGAIVLSPKSAAGRVWIDGNGGRPIAEFNIVGRTLEVILAGPVGDTAYDG